MSQPDRKIAEQAATIYAFVPKHKLLRVASVVNDNDECWIDHGEENRRCACDDAWPVV